MKGRQAKSCNGSYRIKGDYGMGDEEGPVITELMFWGKRCQAITDE